MPANLPPHYFDVEKKLRTAVTPEEKIAIYEELLSIIPKHKGTEKIQGQLKSKISKCKDAAQKRSGAARHGPSYKVRKSGAGQVVVIGPANAGKSMLIASLTGAQLQVSDYPYTTVAPSPAMMNYEKIQIQLVDMPPISPDFMEPWYPEVIKPADGALLVVDLSDIGSGEMLPSLLAKLRDKKIEFVGQGQESFNQGGWSYKKALVVANKSDHAEAAENFELLQAVLDDTLDWVQVSAASGTGLEELKRKIFLMLGIIRIYSKAPGKKAELNSPFTLKRGSTVMDMARAVHQDFAHKLKFARIWGKNTYDGQRVNRDHVLEDEDILELHI